MKTNIEKYLDENRLKLDTELPDDSEIWNGISSRIAKQRSVQTNQFWKLAAVFLLGVLITYVIVNETKNEKVVVVTLGDVSDELGQKESELQLVADKKWQEISPLSEQQKSEFSFLLDELDELDKIYATYSNDLTELGSNEQIISTLLDYYEKKINILNRLALEIQKQENHENNVTL